jgi:isocitrate dehydrogenase kinase/phosphatase
MDILILIGVLIIGISWGWALREKIAKDKVNFLLEQVEKTETENVIKIKIEKHNDVLFVYDFHTDMFMVQANDRSELEQKLDKMYPGKKFGATPDNLKKIGFTS